VDEKLGVVFESQEMVSHSQREGRRRFPRLTRPTQPDRHPRWKTSSCSSDSIAPPPRVPTKRLPGTVSKNTRSQYTAPCSVISVDDNSRDSPTNKSCTRLISYLCMIRVGCQGAIGNQRSGVKRRRRWSTVGDRLIRCARWVARRRQGLRWNSRADWRARPSSSFATRRFSRRTSCSSTCDTGMKSVSFAKRWASVMSSGLSRGARFWTARLILGLSILASTTTRSWPRISRELWFVFEGRHTKHQN